MDWKLMKIDQETDHRFLNFFTFHYTVQDEKGTRDYPYFVASRHDREHLVVNSEKPLRPDGVLIVALTEENEPSLLVIREFRPAFNDFIIALPAGLMDEQDPSPLVTASRECQEETGMILSDVSLLCPGSPTSAGLSDEVVAVVEGTIKAQGQSALETFEDISASLVPLSSLRDILDDPNVIVALNVRLLMLFVLERYEKERSVHG